MIRLIWAVVWRVLIGSTLAWNVIGGPLKSTSSYPYEMEFINFILAQVIFIGSIILSIIYVRQNKERWLADKKEDTGDTGDAI